MASFLSSLFCCCSFPGKAPTKPNTMEKQEKERPLPTKGAPSKRQISNPIPPNHKKSAAASTVSANNSANASPSDTVAPPSKSKPNPKPVTRQPGANGSKSENNQPVAVDNSTTADSAGDSPKPASTTAASANNNGSPSPSRTANKPKTKLIITDGSKDAPRCESTPPVPGPHTPVSANSTGSSRHQVNASMGHIPMEYVTPEDESDKEVAIKGRRHSVPILGVGHSASGDAYDHSNHSNINTSTGGSVPPLPNLVGSSSTPATRSSSVNPLPNSGSTESSINENTHTQVYDVNPDQYTQSSLMMSNSYEDLTLPTHALLPEADPSIAGRKCLVLDLDETLVHSSFKYLWNADFVIPVEIEGMWHDVYVVKRPGVDEFLQRVSEMYEVVVFTASVAKYGDPLLDYLDANNVVHHRLFRESCTNKNGIYVKELSVLGRPLENVIIIDNSPAAYSSNPHNAIPVSSWFSDVHDSELMDMIPFLEDLASKKVPDVINVLRTEW